jgi:hypothetical protein
MCVVFDWKFITFSQLCHNTKRRVLLLCFYNPDGMFTARYELNIEIKLTLILLFKWIVPHAVYCGWNVMAHAQKPDFVLRRKGRGHLNRQGASVQSTTGRRAVNISLQGLYCSCKPVFCSHVTLTDYPLHSLVSPSLLQPCVTVCHHISTGLYCSSGDSRHPILLVRNFLCISGIR